MSKTNGHCEENASPLATDEFARGAAVWPTDLDGTSRRAFLKRMAAALALAGIGGVGCSSRSEKEKLVPYVNAPEGVTAGKATIFATTMPMNGYGRGVLAASREGRPIKIEGNPDHPSSLGGTDAFMQASILDLYDPARSKSPTLAGSPTDWAAFFAALAPRLAAARANGGAGFRVLSGTVTSPTLAAQIAEFEKQFPNARWHHFDPLAQTNTMAGTVAAFGRPLNVVYDFTRAKTIVSLDADFLFEMAGSVRYARDFADGRRVRAGHAQMSRLYVAESSLTLTGARADHRLPCRPGEVESIARALASACGVGTAGSSPIADPNRARWVNAVAEELRAHAGSSLVVAGESQPAEVHALAHAINHALGNVGSTVSLFEPFEVAAGDQSRSLVTLVDEMNAGHVDTLLIFADNPAYAAPADVAFADAITRLSTARNGNGSLTHFTAHLGQRANETGFVCQWHLPETHYLEQWGDLRAHDGSASITQPLIAPMHGGRSVYEVVEAILGRPDRSGYEIVRAYWQHALTRDDFESQWQAALKRGVIGTTPRSVNVGAPTIPATTPAPHDDAALDLVFRPDPSAWDGSFAGNAWLQELPRPLTKIVWDNAALLGPATAAAHKLETGDLVRLAVGDRSIEVPVAILPGTPDGTITLHLGYGQDLAIADQEAPAVIGTNAYRLRPAGVGFISGVALTKLDRTHNLVRTRSHFAMSNLKPDVGVIDNDTLKPNAIVTSDSPADDRDSGKNRRLVRIATLAAFEANPNIIKDLGGETEKKPLLSLYPEWDYSKGYQWGMSIDQTACIGCNACIVACQAENNIPVVGKEQVDKQREMHWLRVDDYFGGDDAQNPQVTHQPVPCMHCENAPCEVVCPVGATTHSVEGLNQMTYNRCVGTRYCSNNCPYKVRRFNFLDYTSKLRGSTERLQKNPEVTVRSRGVMEKCSYCVQRLQQTRIDVERVTLDLRERARTTGDETEKRQLLNEAASREFEMIDRLDTACAQACPTRAITFGSIIPVAGQKTRLMNEKAQPLDYVLLRELTTKPRTSYLGRITNPNPALADGGVT